MGVRGKLGGWGIWGGGWVGVSDTRGPHNPLLPVSLRLRTLYRTVKISFVLKMLYFFVCKGYWMVGLYLYHFYSQETPDGNCVGKY